MTDRIRPQRLAAAVCLLLLLVPGVLVVIPGQLRLLEEAGPYCFLPPEPARRRAFGERYTDALSHAMRAIPEHGVFLLVDRPPGGFNALLVRFHLQPRQAILYSQFRGRNLPAAAVISGGDPPDPPSLSSAAELTPPLLRLPGTREDPAILCAIDSPQEEAVLGAENLVVTGWCQQPGGISCSTIVVVLDHQPLESTPDRYPRPDVAAVLPHLGNCSTAGFRLELPAALLRLGKRHLLEVYFATPDGRFRRVPREFAIR